MDNERRCWECEGENYEYHSVCHFFDKDETIDLITGPESMVSPI